MLTDATERRAAYQMQYAVLRKLLSANYKDIPLSEIMDYIEKVVVDNDRKLW